MPQKIPIGYVRLQFCCMSRLRALQNIYTKIDRSAQVDNTNFMYDDLCLYYCYVRVDVTESFWML